MERHGQGEGGIGARDREVRCDWKLDAGRDRVAGREERRWRESGGGGEIDMVRWGNEEEDRRRRLGGGKENTRRSTQNFWARSNTIRAIEIISGPCQIPASSFQKAVN
jgi:hypothetical protein